MSSVSNGKIILSSNTNVWPHELLTAKALADAGHIVEFIRRSNLVRETTADAYIDGDKWEFKAPRSGKKSAIEDNLKKAARQSNRVVFDSRRMKRIPDKAIAQELRTCLRKNKVLCAVKFVDRHGEVVDIDP